MKTHLPRLNRRGASFLTTALLVGLIAIVAIAALGRLGGNVSALFTRTGNTLILVNNTAGVSTGTGGGGSGSSGPTGGPFNSCKTMKDANATMTGIAQQTVTINGTPRQVVCDMSTFGGGWTLIAAQFDSDPLGWNAGIASHTYAPALTSKISFVFSSAEIPSHTQTGFGRIEGSGGGYDALMLDAVSSSYITGNINPANVANSINSATQYYMHRNATGFYNCHEIDGSCSGGNQNAAGSTGWGNSLTFDIRSGNATADWNWAFSPEQTSQHYRGFSNGGNRQDTIETYAWALWVR